MELYLNIVGVVLLILSLFCLVVILLGEANLRTYKRAQGSGNHETPRDIRAQIFISESGGPKEVKRTNQILSVVCAISLTAGIICLFV